MAATRDAVGDSMAIMVDLNQGWRMAGDTTPSIDPVAARAIAARLAEYDVLWVEEPLAGTDLRGLAALRASATGRPHRRRRDDPDLHASSLAAVDADAFDVHQPDVVLAAGMSAAADAGRARPRPEPLVHAAHLDERHRPAGEPARRRPASVAARSSSSRTTRPGGPRSGATSCSPSRSGPDADGILRVPSAPGLGIVLDEAAVKRFAA